MKKIVYVMLIMIFFSAQMSQALAAGSPKNLIEWDTSVNISDTFGENENSNSPIIDVAQMESYSYGKDSNNDSNDQLDFIIKNAYPGYVATAEAKIINMSSKSVTLYDVTITDTKNPNAVKVEITDKDGTPIQGQKLNGNATLGVKLTATVTELAEQNDTYLFSAAISAKQIPRGDDDNDNDNDNDTDTDTDTDTDDDDDDDDDEPITVTQPPVLAPLIPVELPYTGGNIALFAGTGLALGCIGLILRRRK